MIFILPLHGTGAFGESHLSLPWQHKKLALLDYGLDPGSFPPQLSRDWPKGRFIWFTADRQCRLFVNFIDHIKLVITQSGGDIQKAFRQYSELLSAMEGCLTRKGNKFMWSSKYGFLTSSPNDIGTGLEVQVKARLPKLIKVKTMFKKVYYSSIRKEDKRPGNGIVNSPGF